VYGDHVHQNDGAHLDGGIANDPKWQEHWRSLIVYPSQTYDAPKGAVGRCYVEKVADLMEAIMDQKSNREKLIVFALVVLQRTCNVTCSTDIWKRIMKCIDACEEGKCSWLGD